MKWQGRFVKYVQISVGNVTKNVLDIKPIIARNAQEFVKYVPKNVKRLLLRLKRKYDEPRE